MICSYCDNAIPAGAHICPSCGGAVPGAVATAASAAPTTASAPSAVPPIAPAPSPDALPIASASPDVPATVSAPPAVPPIAPVPSPDVWHNLKSLGHRLWRAVSPPPQPGTSPRKRIIFLLLGIVLGPLGIQFLYARRMVPFYIILACTIAAPFFGENGLNVSVLSVLTSFVSSFFAKKDGNGLRMAWY